MKNAIISECFDKSIDNLAKDVVKLIVSRNLTVATAESCTGGLISELITSVSGASSVFELGICTYANRMKTKFLDVPEEELVKFGAVSGEVALSMVRGLKNCSGADVCVSVTGIAGPNGGTAEKPVGTVWLGFSICGIEFTELLPLWRLPNGSRDDIRQAAAKCAFAIILKVLLEEV